MNNDHITVTEKLAAWGATPQAAIHRLLDDEPMYISLLKQLLQSQDAQRLSSCIAGMDYSSAFGLAHQLKGSALTLSLLPLCDPLTCLTDLLRPYYQGRSTAPSPKEREAVEDALHQFSAGWKQFCELFSSLS